jgi:hypothetical protein
LSFGVRPHRASGEVHLLRRITLALAVFLVLGPGTAFASSVDSWNLPLPSSPRQISATAAGIYFADVNTGINRIDPTTDTLSRWPASFAVTSPGAIAVYVDATNHSWVFVTDNNVAAPRIGRLDPASGLYTTWDLPPAVFGALRSLSIDPSGSVFFSGRYSVARLDPATNIVTVWALPPYLATVGSDSCNDVAWWSGYAFYSVNGSAHNFVGALDPGANATFVWSSPKQINSQLGVTAAGEVFATVTPTRVIRLDPFGGWFREWTFGKGLVSEFLSLNPAGNPMITGAVGSAAATVAVLDRTAPGTDTRAPLSYYGLQPQAFVVGHTQVAIPRTDVVLSRYTAFPTLGAIGAFMTWSGGGPTRGISVDPSGAAYFTDNSPSVPRVGVLHP